MTKREKRREKTNLSWSFKSEFELTKLENGWIGRGLTVRFWGTFIVGKIDATIRVVVCGRVIGRGWFLTKGLDEVLEMSRIGDVVNSVKFSFFYRISVKARRKIAAAAGEFW
ncbi:hypothetical protein U1Q18_033236 [Sarracenia purpurea var. burkii]